MDTYTKVFLGIFIVFLSSCVKDDDTTFLESDVTGNDIVSSLAMISTLNYFKINSLTNTETDCCFSFVYPLTLKYNTGVKMKVYNYDGLIETVNNQSADFNLMGIEFPVKIIPQGSNIAFLINDEVELINLLNSCNISTLRNDFDMYVETCFKVEFPIVVYDKNEKEVNISNQEGLDTFLDDQGVNYQPDFKFPINLLVTPDYKLNKISSYYDFYEIINDCRLKCPGVDFDIVTGTYNLFGLIPYYDYEDDYKISLIVDGDIVDNDDFLLYFTPGVYEVCIEITTPDCPTGMIMCKELIADTICPDGFNVSYEPLGLNIYEFIPPPLPPPPVDPEVYSSEILFFVNDEIIVDQVVDQGPFSRYFAPGTYDVCFQIITSNCPDGVRSCEQLVVTPICPTISFTYLNSDPYGGGAHLFTPTVAGQVEGSELIEWSLDGSFVRNGGQSDSLDFVLNVGANNTVCAKIVTQWCPDGVEYCTNIYVP
ncbi:hypothetical protein ABW636_11120 [Aquimarina sp. 2201CG1-2-11]|uniref:hypothetical protein n=1 Tax=Aquimarina discodermiae TaxID=3231043 RepID=UPI003461CE81